MMRCTGLAIYRD